MAMADDDATRRSNAIAAVNAMLADIVIAKKRVDDAEEKHAKLLNDSKSEIGTARTELNKLEATYDKAREKLLGLVPKLHTAHLPEIVAKESA